MKASLPPTNISTPCRVCPPSGNCNPDLQEYNQTFLGISGTTKHVQRIGKPLSPLESSLPSPLDPAKPWARTDPPTPTKLHTLGFGTISEHHSFTQETSFESMLLLLFKRMYLAEQDLTSLQKMHALFGHLYQMLHCLSTFDFGMIHEANKNWTFQSKVPFHRKVNSLTCLLHYIMHIANVMWYTGGNYTAECQNLLNSIKLIQNLVDPDLFTYYMCIMWSGTLARFNISSI
jgi:hypothetical protein